MSLPKIGETRTASFYLECVACKARYRPKYMRTAEYKMVCVSDHVCDPARLAKREEELRHEFDDPPQGCDCDDLDCKFEYLESIMLEME